MISLRVPASPASVAIVRSVAANVVATADVPYESVDDLRLAVAEACNRLLDVYPAATRLRLDARIVGRMIELSVSVEQDGGASDGDPANMPWQIIEALTDRAEERTVDGRPTISMYVSMVPAHP